MTDELKEAINRVRNTAYAECDEDAYQYLDDCKRIAHAHVAANPADSDTPITEGWLESIGFQFERDSGVHFGSLGLLTVRRDLDGFDYLEWLIDGDPKLKFKRPQTRGDLRRLAAALGIELKGTPTL